MAKISWGALVTDGRGRLSGGSLSKNGSGNLIVNRAMTGGHRKQSASAHQINFASISNVWRSLTENELQSNRNAVAEVLSSDRFGVSRKVGAYQWFMRCNINRLACGLDILRVVYSVPVKTVAVINPIYFAFLNSQDGRYIGSFFNLFLSEGNNITLLFYISRRVNQGVSRYSGSYSLAKTFELIGGTYEVFGPDWPPLLLAHGGDKFFIKMVIVDNPTGIVLSTLFGSAVFI